MHAAIATQLHRTGRAADRLTVDRASTLRGDRNDPVDATIENISLTGCRLHTAADLQIGEVVAIGLAGVGMRSSRVVHATDGRFGCSFDIPLTDAELQETLVANTVTEMPVAKRPPPEGVENTAVEPAALSPRSSLLLFAALGVAGLIALAAGVAFILVLLG